MYGKEIWLPVADNPMYEVSSKGNVRNAKTGRVLRQEITYRGYARVNLSGRHRYVHRLVADAFYDDRNGDLDINHIDGDKLNNFIGNLERCTRSENIQHAFNTGLKIPSRLKIVRCKYCIYRNENPYCRSKSDDFYCADGKAQ